MSVTVEPVPPPVEPDPDIPTEPIYRLSVAQYHAMAKAGILDEDAPVELLEGWLVRKMSQDTSHVVVSGLLHDALIGLISGGWHVRAGNPVTTSDSEPEPDLAVLRGARRDYPDRHPGPQDTALVVEVADTSLSRDRGRKKRIYARGRIPAYWIVNLVERQVEVYTEPAGAGRRADYRQRRDYGPDDEIPVVLDDVAVGVLSVRDLLP